MQAHPEGDVPESMGEDHDLLPSLRRLGAANLELESPASVLGETKSLGRCSRSEPWSPPTCCGRRSAPTTETAW